MKDASKKQPSFSSVAIAGPGLLGGSLALAVRARMPHVHVRLWGRRPEPLEYALSIGAAHAVSTRVEEVVQGADLVVLATPVGVMLDIVTAMLPALKPGAVVTDVGSVKGCVHQSVGAVLTRAGVA
ncbi:MAG: prephenate dehydrogenase/arogenate dehydrogenase family protein, partial [Akkermansia sp.]